MLRNHTSSTKRYILCPNQYDYGQRSSLPSIGEIFNDAQTLLFVQTKCIDDIALMKPSSPFLSIVEPQFFNDIIVSLDVDACRLSGHASLLVAAHCRRNQLEIGQEMFDR